ASRFHAVSPSLDDGPGHDHRHDSDGPRARRWRRAKRPAGTRRYWRSSVRNGFDALLCSHILQHAAWMAAERYIAGIARTANSRGEWMNYIEINQLIDNARSTPSNKRGNLDPRSAGRWLTLSMIAVIVIAILYFGILSRVQT